MGTKTMAAATLRRWRRGLGALRSLNPVAASILTAALIIGGAGIADAATGGYFILGQANDESSTASLSNSAGTPLGLNAPLGTAPLAVNRSTMVNNLNAQYVGGLSGAKVKSTGGTGSTAPDTRTPLTTSWVKVVQTGALPAGTYYVTATALLYVPSGAGDCKLVKGSTPTTAIQYGGTSAAGWIQTAETAAVAVAAGDIFQELCYANQTSAGAFAYNAGITAIRVLSSSGTPAATSASGSVSRPPQIGR